MEFGSAVANGGKDIVSEDELANHNKVLDTYGPHRFAGLKQLAQGIEMSWKLLPVRHRYETECLKENGHCKKSRRSFGSMAKPKGQRGFTPPSSKKIED
jgi:hypothetical protein